MSEAIGFRTVLAGLVLMLAPAERAYAVDCEYIIYLHEQASVECNSGVTFPEAKYQPCDMVEMRAPAYRACTRKDLSCVEVSAPITALRPQGCVALNVSNTCSEPQRLYLEGIDLDHSSGAFDTYDLTRDEALLSCCGSLDGCSNFNIVHAEAIQ